MAAKIREVDVSDVGVVPLAKTGTSVAERWTELEADQVSVFDGTPDRPGAVLEVFREASGATWRFRMTDRLWATLVREVAREIGFPWFNAALASGAVDTEP